MPLIWPLLVSTMREAYLGPAWVPQMVNTSITTNQLVVVVVVICTRSSVLSIGSSGHVQVAGWHRPSMAAFVGNHHRHHHTARTTLYVWRTTTASLTFKFFFYSFPHSILSLYFYSFPSFSYAYTLLNFESSTSEFVVRSIDFVYRVILRKLPVVKTAFLLDVRQIIREVCYTWYANDIGVFYLFYHIYCSIYACHFL